MNLDDQLYFYDKNDKEYVGKIVEYHARKVGRKQEHKYYVKIKKGRVVVEENGWHEFSSKNFNAITIKQVSSIRKGAIVHVNKPMGYDIVYEAKVLKIVRDNYHVGEYVAVRFRKLVSGDGDDNWHGYKEADSNYIQHVPIEILTIVKNGNGRRIELM